MWPKGGEVAGAVKSVEALEVKEERPNLRKGNDCKAVLVSGLERGLD